MMGDYWINAPIKIIDLKDEIYQWDKDGHGFTGNLFQTLNNMINILGELLEPYFQLLKPYIDLFNVPKEKCRQCKKELDIRWNYCPRCGKSKWYHASDLLRKIYYNQY